MNNTLTISNILTLQLLPKIGRKTVKIIIENTSQQPCSIDGYIDLLDEAKKNTSRVNLPDRAVISKALTDAEAILDACNAHNIIPLSVVDIRFPNRLKNIPDSPNVIYTKGDISSLHQKYALAFVGTREPSGFGFAFGKKLAKLISEKGFCIVSGLAVGCDTAAHEGCLEGNGKTVAVLAHGLDTVYPPKNKRLADQILSLSGCLISEYPPGSAPRRNFFVERDRIQSGLSNAVFVIETDVKGGTMHTVKFCLEQKRILACLDHPEKFAINNSKSQGNKVLIRDGKAMPIFDVDSIDAFMSKITITQIEDNCSPMQALTSQLDGV